MKKAAEKIESGKTVPESARKMIAALIRCDPLKEDKRKPKESTWKKMVRERELEKEAHRPKGRKMRRSAWTMQSASVIDDNKTNNATDLDDNKDASLVGMTLTVTHDTDEAQPPIYDENHERTSEKNSTRKEWREKKKDFNAKQKLLAEKKLAAMPRTNPPSREVSISRVGNMAVSPSSYWSHRLEEITRWHMQQQQQNSTSNNNESSSSLTSFADLPSEAAPLMLPPRTGDTLRRDACLPGRKADR